MNTPLDFASLRSAIEGRAIAIRRIQRLVPAGGAADKVFPPTYEGGQYATEERILDGRRVPCVLLDSVQSQANRMELALRQACYRGKSAVADIPVVTVDFAAANLPEVGEITSLDAPHRLADAILRDSVNAGQRFRDSAEGRVLDLATAANATGLFGLCPTALVFGMWDSTGPRGGLGTKFQRALVSEVVGIDIQTGVRPSSRIDPLGIVTGAADIYRRHGTADAWTLDPTEAVQEKGKAVRYGKDGKPSEINHGNVTPSLVNERGQPHHGGVSLAYAEQITVLSLASLRRLAFPDDSNRRSAERDHAAQAALASLALAGAQLAIDQGLDLRSRCLLVPDAASPASWEIVAADGMASSCAFIEPLQLIRQAGEAAAAVGLPAWRRAPLVLQPSAGLTALVRRSRELAAVGQAEA